MADKANVTDVDVLERFRTQLMLFVEKATLCIDEVSEEVKRTRHWLQSEQKMTLEREMRTKQKKMEMVEAELYSARLTDANERITGIQMQMRHLKQEIRDLETKQRALQAWNRHFDSKVEVEARKVEKLQSVLDSEMSNAVKFLNEAAKALHDYSTPQSG